jgi:hypothetical protein
MSPTSRLLAPATPRGGFRPTVAQRGAGAKRSPRDERLPLREAAPLVVAMSLTLWSAVGALVWLVLG